MSLVLILDGNPENRTELSRFSDLLREVPMTTKLMGLTTTTFICGISLDKRSNKSDF